MDKILKGRLKTEAMISANGIYKFIHSGCGKDTGESISCSSFILNSTHSAGGYAIKIQSHCYEDNDRNGIHALSVKNAKVKLESLYISESDYYITLVTRGSLGVKLHGSSKIITLQTGDLAIIKLKNVEFETRNSNAIQMLLPISTIHAYTLKHHIFDAGIVFLTGCASSPFIVASLQYLEENSERVSNKLFFSILDRTYHLSVVLINELLNPEINGCDIFLRAKNNIEDCYYDEKLSPEFICKFIGCSRAVLDRAFKEQQTTVMSVILLIRLNVARYRLEQFPEERIKTVAYHCGFSSQSFFGKSFKKRYGVSPVSWRRFIRS